MIIGALWIPGGLVDSEMAQGILSPRLPMI